MTVVGILSDTHGRLHADAYEALADCDHIIHAGDIGDPRILDELRTLAPVTAVLGNNDFDEYGASVQRFASVAIDGVRFLVAHYPHEVVYAPAGAGCRALSPGDPIPDVAVHGHIHVPRLEAGAAARPAQLLVCPGSASLPRGGSPRCVAKVRMERGRLVAAAVERLNGSPVLTWPEKKPA